MKRVAFMLENGRFSAIDCRFIENGNPGLGGTQYMFWYVASKLSAIKTDFEVFLYAQSIDLLPSYVKSRKIDSNDTLFKQIEIDKVDLLIVWGPNISKDFYKRLERTDLKVITWSHNYERYPQINNICRCNNIVRNICVGKEQLDRLVDDKLYEKSDFIYNTIDLSCYKISTEKYRNSICFLGSIIPEKGFHELARIWPKVEKKVPDAQLYIIGGGNLYNKKIDMGKYGIASSQYERTFIKYLINNNGELKDNVHFLGAKGGKEKNELLSKMCVGIAKSTMTRETFCICAIEFQACNVPVVSAKKYSMVEVVDDNKTGKLFKNRRDFVKCIVEVLNNQDLCNGGRHFVSEKFNENDVIEKWKRVITDSLNDVPVNHSNIFVNKMNCKKWLRLLNAKAKKIMPFLPSIAWWEDVPHIINYTIKSIRGRK